MGDPVDLERWTHETPGGMLLGAGFKPTVEHEQEGLR